MQAELKINRGGDKNELMVIDRARSTTATWNSELDTNTTQKHPVNSSLPQLISF